MTAMTTTRTRRRFTALAALALSAGLLAGCADNGGGGSDDAEGPTADRGGSMFAIGFVGDQLDGEPTDGGQLSISTFGEVRSMDPVDLIANGLSGGSELAAIYDVLVRYDPETAEYEPHVAESLEPNDDSTVWTMTLREGVNFSDGTPLDAAAVVGSIERYLADEGGQASLWSSKVAKTEATDERTVTFTLSEPWVDFEYMLATAPGMIMAPAAYAGAEFTPIGAGPFTFGHYRPSEELLLEANPDYWGGEPPLDQLRFHNVQTAEGTFDVVRSGSSDVGVVREPSITKEAIDEGFGGAMNVVSMGFGLIVNNREDSATGDVRVRQAIAHAIDPEGIYARTYNGVGLPGTEMFPEESQWGGAPGPEIDLDKAKQLVEEAKADGFDGKVGYLGIQVVSQNTGLGLEAMLGQIGIELEPEYVAGSADMIQRVFAERSFDLAGWSFGTPDAAVFPELYENFHSESRSNAAGYASETMDGLLEELGAAESEDEQQDLINQIQEEWNATIPSIVLGAQPEFVMWGEHVGGVVPHVDSMMLYHQAWSEK